MDDIKSILNESKSESTESTSNIKDRLCTIAASGESKKYLGKEYSIKEIEALSPKEQEKLFNLYEIKFGKEIVRTLGYSILSLYSRLLGIATPIDLLGFNVNLKSEEALTKDLNDDPIISQTMGHLLTEVCYKYGVYLSPLTAMLITTKHLEFNKSSLIIKEDVNGTEVSQQQENNEANSSNQIQKAVKSVTKRVERAKNPKRVEQGKKLAEHNKKMKQQLVKMKLADEANGEESNQNKIYQTVTEKKNLILGGLGVAGVVIYLIWRNKCSARQVSVQPKRVVGSIPKQEPILDME